MGSDDGIKEVVDLTEKEVEVVECYDNNPLDCVMMRIVKQEPGLEEEEAEEGGREEAAAAGGSGTGGEETATGATAGCLGSSGVAAAGAGAGAAAATGSSATTPRVKMEVG